MTDSRRTQRAGFTDTQRVALLESDMDEMEAALGKLMARLSWLIGTTFLLAIAIFSAVVSVAAVR